MADINSLNFERILWCCRDRGISLQQLGDAVGMNRQKLELVFRDEVALSISQLKKIARFFNRGLLFFVESGPVREDRIRTAGFRTLANENPALDIKIKTIIERVERQRQILLSLQEDNDEVSVIKFKPPFIDSDRITEAAQQVRDWLEIENDLTFDGYRTAIEKKGILVFRSNGYAGAWQIPANSSVWGFSIIHTEFPIIFVRKAVSESRQLFTLIHELGHLILHSRGFVDDLDDLYSHVGRERDANAFAGNLLVPNEFLSQISDEQNPREPNRYESWLKPFTSRWGVSAEVILRRLLDSKRLGKDEYEAYREWKKTTVVAEGKTGSRAYRFREPKHIFGDYFVKSVLEALHSKQITLSKASTYLDNLKISDIHKLERVYNAF